MNTRSLALVVAALASIGMACSKSPPPAPETSTTSARAEIGTARAVAPPFELKDLEGKSVKLSDFKGKTVVLEWFNPDCPFVRNSHTKGSLVTTAKTYTDKGIVWLSINSSAEGKQGNGVEANQAGVEKFAMHNPVLLDPAGTIGKAYGATNTPHMFVIDADGKIAYRGAIDNSPDGEGDSPTGGKLVNYVSQALDEIAAGKPVSVPESKAYGCSVKYGS